MWLRRPTPLSMAILLTLLLPWLLIHALAGAEIAIGLVGALFLWRCAAAWHWAWLREPWVVVAAAYWVWIVLCTVLTRGLPGHADGAVWQALAFGRLFVFVAALEHWVLAEGRARRWLLISLGAATVYVAVQTLVQFGFGTNLFGVPRYADGSLSGPFVKPRDGPTFVRMLFPVLLPVVGGLLARKGWWPGLMALTLLLTSVGVVVLIGQRMPVLLAVLGLAAAGMLMPRLRVHVVAAVVAGGLLVAATPIVSPPTFARLVTKFVRQMSDFADSAYGVLAERSLAIVGQHPWTGRGYDGFRSGCPVPRYFVPWHWPGGAVPPGDGGGAAICVTHPHNWYLQAVTDGGLPGLVLFCVLVALLMWRLGAGLVRTPDALRIGLFVAALVQVWPVASAPSLQSVPIGAWFFLVLGFGLAEANRARIEAVGVGTAVCGT